jgi:hypothetical protein
MLSIVDGAARARTIRSLRAACELLDATPNGVNAVSVSGLLPDSDDPALPILTLAQALAAERGLAVQVEVDDGRFVVQFRRNAAPGRGPAPEAG